MKITISALILLACVANGLEAQLPTTQSQLTLPAPTPYAIVNQDADSRVWQRQEYKVGPDGQIITNTRSYNELATGLNYWKDGRWNASQERIDILADGTAAAIDGQHKAYFPANINTGRIRIKLLGGGQIISQPLELSYFDGTNTVVLGELTNSIGVVVGNNQVVYPNAFAGLVADLRYTYTKAGFEQDVIIRQQPLTPEAYGLNPDTARLQVVTEVYNCPSPTLANRALPPQAGMTLTDQNVDFGTMQMIRGRAFLLGQSAANPGALVAKSWLAVEGRQFLVEEVPVNAIVEGLAALPLTALNGSPGRAAHLASRRFVLPRHRLETKSDARIGFAEGGLPAKGFVMDYQTVNGSITSYTFQGDTTYYISAQTYLFGTTTFEGGAVLKYTNNADLSTLGNPINWLAGPYRPVVFTSKDDNSVGDSISGSTGTPTNNFANPALDLLDLSATTINGFRISFAKQAIVLANSFGVVNFYNGQIVNCLKGLSVNGAVPTAYPVKLRSVLFNNVNTNFNYPYKAQLDIQNCTFAGSAYLMTIASNTNQTTVLNMTNCILANVANCQTNGNFYVAGDYNGFYNSYTFGNDQNVISYYPFQTVGAGDFYLTNGCGFHNAGTTNIDPYMLASLSQKTTYPPLILSNSITSSPTTLVPQAGRDDVGYPDLGYHYDPIDYIVDTYWITNTTLTLANGVAVACYYDSGFIITDGSSINCTGSALNPNILTSYQTVQEEPVAISLNGSNGPSSILAVNPYHVSVPPSGTFDFTTFTCVAGGGYDIYQSSAGFTYSNLNVCNCQLWGGVNYLHSGTGLTATFNNNLFARSTITCVTIQSCTMSFTNNLFWGGSSVIFRDPSYSKVFAFNNDFDSCTLGTYTTNCVNGYNAFLNCNTQLYPTNATAIVSTNSLNYQTSFLGTFYQPTNSPLILMGSTNANLLGLYHFTTQTNQVVEGTNIVTIGYHYVATDTNGIPLDSNGDGIPDYIEDANGNGLVDSGEIGWNLTNDLGLQVIISEPR